MGFEAERIRDVERQDMCESVRNNSEVIDNLIQEDPDVTEYQRITSRRRVENSDYFGGFCVLLPSRGMKLRYY
jgi:hypothetical protein